VTGESSENKANEIEFERKSSEAQKLVSSSFEEKEARGERERERERERAASVSSD
jgi:hypothetical protein